MFCVNKEIHFNPFFLFYSIDVNYLQADLPSYVADLFLTQYLILSHVLIWVNDLLRVLTHNRLRPILAIWKFLKRCLKLSALEIQVQLLKAYREKMAEELTQAQSDSDSKAEDRMDQNRNSRRWEMLDWRAFQGLIDRDAWGKMMVGGHRHWWIIWGIQKGDRSKIGV